MALLKDEVLILKSTDFSEADKIITVFGQGRGRYGLIAKGVRKLESKNRGNIQTGTLAKISYYEGLNLGVLREADAVESPDFNVETMRILRNVLYMLYKIMPEEEPDETVFKMLKELYSNRFEVREVNRFRVKVLRHLGYLPDLSQCSLCADGHELKYMNTTDFRMCCETCFTKLVESEKTLWQKLTDLRYESTKMDQAIDNYVRKVVDEI